MARQRVFSEVSEQKADVDLTPMLDVVFIMLIFFIVTASFVNEVGIGVSIPDNHRAQEDEPLESIVIHVDASDAVWMEGRRVDIRAVRANVERLRAQNPSASLIIRADIKSTAQTYVAIADAARQAHVGQIALMPSGAYDSNSVL